MSEDGKETIHEETKVETHSSSEIKRVNGKDVLHKEEEVTQKRKIETDAEDIPKKRKIETDRDSISEYISDKKLGEDKKLRVEKKPQVIGGFGF